MAKNKFCEGDVLLFSDGRMAQVLEVQPWDKTSMLQFIDRSEISYIETDKLSIERNLGQSNEVLTNFFGIKSFHVRLNNMGLK